MARSAPASPASADAHHHARQSRKAAASGWIGSALEYYDFFIYATAASLIFPQIFFPKGDPKTAIVASLATYGVGYVARRIGAFFLGHWGDTHGRKKVFMLGVTVFLALAFAVVEVLGHHRAVHGEQDAVDGQGRLEVRQDLVAKGLVDLLYGLAGRLGEGAEAFHHLPAFGLGAATPHCQRRAEHRHVLAVARLTIEAGFLKELVAGRDGGKGIGLGAEARREDLFHQVGCTRCDCSGASSSGDGAKV